MSGNALQLEAQERSVVGKKVTKLRRDGFVPAVVYEKGAASDTLAIPYIQMVKAWNSAGKHHTIQLKYGKKERLTLIKDVTFDPVRGQLSHVAFHAVNKNEKIEAEVPVRLDGNAPAAAAGLIVRTNLDHVVVKGLPGDIPDAISVDVSAIATADDDIRAASLNIPKNIVLLTEPDTVIVSVVVPRAEVEKESEEEVTASLR